MSVYTSSQEELLQEYGSNQETGLTTQQADALLEKYGENKLQAKKHKSFLMKFLDQLKDFMVIILLIAAVVSFVIAMIDGHGDYLDSIIILAIVVLNGILGASQESQAEKSLDALQSMSAPSAKVLRNGSVQQISSSLLVPGDIVQLDAGDFIPADGRILQSASLKCEESALTGESVPVDKNALANISEDAALGDRLNMVYSGCAVTYGRATILITSTGMNTEMGKIAGLLNSAEQEPTPLQNRLNKMGKYLGILIIAICIIVFILGFLVTPAAESSSVVERLLSSFMTAVSLAVAAIPEGLTAVVTVVLALGVQRMVKKNALIRRLPAVETLGSASVICSDKTGTLTQNRMTIQQIWAVGKDLEPMNDHLDEASLQVLRLGTLCNDGKVELVEGETKDIGDPTETAIVAAFQKNGTSKSELDSEYPRVAELPFDSDRKLMTTVHKVGDKLLAVTKGGVDVLLERCNDVDKATINNYNNIMAEGALRVLAVACKEISSLPEVISSETLENGLTFVGLLGMIDPPREESKHAIAECKKAGIITVMITGDHVVTASAIAKELGILYGDYQAVTGQQLHEMSEEELAKNIYNYRVYARVSPEDKIRIVRAWQSRGEVVAMTGDGVNDAPALKAADIGCAMGITGTDVAKDAADMVLTDDNFSTIVEAVKSGRGIYDNILRTVQFLLGSNLGEVFTVFCGLLFWQAEILLPIHLLLVNIVTDALPALALGVEPTDPDVMNRKPIPKDQSIFANGLGLTIALTGIMVSALTLLAYYLGRFVLSDFPADSEMAQQMGMTMAFLVLALSQLVQALNCRSKKSLFRIGIFSNPSMFKAILGSIVVVLAICLIPPLEEVFKMVDLIPADWVAVAILAIAPLPIFELVKGIIYLKNKKK